MKLKGTAQRLAGVVYAPALVAGLAGAEGVPEMTPVLALRVSPAGSEPLVTVHDP